MTLEARVVVERDGFRLDAELAIPPGRTVAVLGPNGAGKTTLAGVLAGLIRPDSGRVVLDGDPLDDTEAGIHVPPERRPVGMVFQDLRLFPHLSALENVAFPLRARRVGRSEARATARALLDRLDVAHRAGARPGRLSGGEAQRVALARALVHEPRLLLLDEPLSALDVPARGATRELIRAALDAFGGVRLLITHDPVEAMVLADRIVVVEAGRVTQAGTPEEIREAPRTRYAAELVGLNLFAGTLVPTEPGTAVLRTAEGDVVVTVPPGATVPVDGVLGLLRPADVSVFLERPEGSARNVLAGRVASVVPAGDRARVRIDSRPPLVAEVTAGSAARLGLRPGAPVWASFKAVEVQVHLP